MNRKLKNSLLYTFLLSTLLVLGACKKTEGEGGNGQLKGKVITEQWNSTFTVLEATYPAADEWVYIIYGDDISYGDRIRTNYNGEYEFKYLREGSYKVYVYSDDKTLQSASGQVAIVKDVKVSEKKTSEVEVITICK